MIKKNIKNFISMIRIDHWFKNVLLYLELYLLSYLPEQTFQIEK